jgi:signal transduction histidine kinase
MLIGGFAISSTHKSQIALLDKSIDVVSASIHQDSTAALSEALYAVQQSDISLSLVYFSATKVATVLTQAQLKKVPNPTETELKNSFSRPQSHVGIESYRFRSVHLTQEEYVVIAGSLGEINAQYKSDRFRLLGFAFVWLILAIFATWIYIRRDIKQIENLIRSATDISNGNTGVEIPAGQGDSEVDQLSDSLNRMVIALRRTAEIEEASAKRMQDFLGDASHELRTPLTVVKGYIELLSGADLADPAHRKRAFDRVGSEITRMENLIKDLLFLAEFGLTPDFAMEELDFSDLVQSHISDFQLLNSARPIEVDLVPDVVLSGSRPHLERLLANIFGNITRHTPNEAPVRVTLLKVGPGLELIIEDGGPGLPENAYQSGVQSFQRFDKSRSREHGGSGLGMSIIFAIVNEHKGKVILGKSALGGLRLHLFFDNLIT